MGIRERLEADQREAMRQGQSLRLDTIRLLRTAIQNAEQARRKALTDELLDKKKAPDAVESAETEEKPIDLSEQEIEAIAKGAALADQDILDTVVTREVKQRRDSIEQYRKAGRQDLVDREEAELQILVGYLPEQLSAVEVEALVAATIAEVGASGPRDMGKVMGKLTPQLRGKADMGQVSKIVQRLLAGSA